MTEEERKTVSAAQSGDKAATEKILNEYKNLVRSIARGFILPGGETEDLVQEGMIGVYAAIGAYDEKEGSSFKNFVCSCVKYKIFDVLKKNLSKGKKSVRFVPLFESEDLFVSDPEENILLSEEKTELLKRLGRILSDFEYRVFTLYLEGVSVAEICETVGRDAKSVDNAVQRSKKKLANQYYGGK